MLQSQPVTTLRVTWDELMRHRDEIAPDAVLEVKVYEPEPPPAVDAENQALIDLLRSWREEDATNIPEIMEGRDVENAELMTNLHANCLTLRDPEV